MVCGYGGTCLEYDLRCLVRVLAGVSPALHRSGYERLYGIRISLCERLGGEQVVLQHRNALVVHIDDAYGVAVAVAAVVVVLYKTQLVIGHRGSQLDAVAVELVHCEVLCDIVGRESVLCQQSLDLVLVAETPVADHSLSRRGLDYLLVGHCSCGRAGAFLCRRAVCCGNIVCLSASIRTDGGSASRA